MDRTAENSRFYLKWNDFDKQLSSGFSDLFHTRDLVDVTLCCEGQTTQAHKVILGINSVFFRQIFKDNPCKHPIVIINGMKFKELTNVLEFIYHGQVNVVKGEIPHFIAAAELLKIDGISAQNSNVNSNSNFSTDGDNKVKEPIEPIVSSPHHLHHHHHQHDSQRNKPTSAPAHGSIRSDEDDLLIIEDNSTASLSPINSKSVGLVKNPLHRSTEIPPFNDSANVTAAAAAGAVVSYPENRYSPVIPDPRSSTSVLMSQLQRPPYGKNSTWASSSESLMEVDAATTTTISSSSSTTTTRQKSETNPDALSSSSNFKDNQHHYHHHHPHHHSQQQQSCSMTPYGACCVVKRPNSREGTVPPEDEGEEDGGEVDPLKISSPSQQDALIRSDHNNNPSGEYELSINSVEGVYSSHLKTFTTPSGMIVTSTLRPMRPPQQQDTQQHVSGGGGGSSGSSSSSSSSWSIGGKPNTSPGTNKGSMSAAAALVFSSGSQILSRLPTHIPAKKRFSHQTEVTETIPSTLPPSSSSSSSSPSSSSLEMAATAAGLDQQQLQQPGGGKCVVVVNGSGNAIISSAISLSPSVTATTVESRFKNQKHSQVPLSVRYTTAEVDAIVDSVNKHTGPFVPCRICDKLVKRERLRAHIHECHLIQGHRIICPHCGVGLKSKGSYRVHVWRHRKASAFAARKTKNLAHKASSSSALASASAAMARPTPENNS